jgi:prevent-host-death family protein
MSKASHQYDLGEYADKSVPVEDLANTLTQTVEILDKAPVLITESGQPKAVLIGLEKFLEMEEAFEHHYKYKFHKFLRAYMADEGSEKASEHLFEDD